MKSPRKPKKNDIPKQNNKLRVKQVTKRTTAEPLDITNILSKGSSVLQSNIQTNCAIEGATCKRKANGGSDAELVSSLIGSTSGKIKLQLFPADEHTRTGLEKDGFCPYLELTLSPRKKISSVLKHIMTKWSKSIIAIGEPRLYSCSIENVHLTSQRVWTLDDSTTCVRDVLEALGRPSIFRLWYCWFHEYHSYPSSSMFIPASDFSQNEAPDKCTDYYENRNVKQNETMTNNKFHLTNVPDIAASSEDNFLGAYNSHLGEEVKADWNSDNNVLSWFDSCTNISIGGLFSEASLQGKLNTGSILDACMSKPNQDTPGTNVLAASNVHHIGSSILDAEDTCSSFSFRKLLSSGANVPLTYNINSSNSHPSSSSQVAAAQGGSNDLQEAKTDKLLGSVYTDDRSLGLRSIKWTDSLGPFDIFVPPSQSKRHGSS